MTNKSSRTRERGAGGDLLTPEQAARLLGVKKSSLAADRCRRSWDIPYFKLGSAVKYSRADLEAYLAKCRVDRSNEDENGILIRDA